MPTLANYPIQIDPPDISIYRKSNTGIDYFNSFTAAEPGPHIMITALVHGNELCGAVVLDELLQANFRPLRGTVTFGFCNVLAFEQFNHDYPWLSRFIHDDMNRLWDTPSLLSNQESYEINRCLEIKPILDTVDLLLDIHSMQHPTPPLMLCGSLKKGRQLAKIVGAPKFVVIDKGHNSGRRMRDYDFFSDPKSPRSSLLVECGQHWSEHSVAVARETTIRFLANTGSAPQTLINDWLDSEEPAAQTLIQITDLITAESEFFQFIKPYVGMESIPQAGTLLATDGNREIHTPYDNCLLIMPSLHPNKDQTAVRLGKIVD